MAIILDIISVALCIFLVVYGYKKGFFKSMMNLLSALCALFVAYTFTPALSAFINDNVVKVKVAKGIGATLTSLAHSVSDEGKDVYDITALLESRQFLDMAEHCKAGEEEISAIAESAQGTEVIDQLSSLLAAPISKAFSNILAFIILAFVSFVLIFILCLVVGKLFTLPVLREIDSFVGAALGAVFALVFLWTFAFSLDTLFHSLGDIAPSEFSENIVDKSILLRFFANLNPLSLISAGMFK